MTEATEARIDSALPADAIRGALLASTALKRKAIDLSKWWPELAGVEIYIQSMSASDRSRYEASMDFDPMGNARDRHNIQAKLAVRVLVDAGGKRVFTDEDLEHVAELNSAAVQHIFNVGAELNGLTKESLAELEKNSESPPTDS